MTFWGGKKRKAPPSQLPLAPDDCLRLSPEVSRATGHCGERACLPPRGLGTDTRGRQGSNVHVAECRQQAGENLAVVSAKPQPGSILSGHNVGNRQPPWGCREWESHQVTPRQGTQQGTQVLLRVCPNLESPPMEMPFSFFCPLLHA